MSVFHWDQNIAQSIATELSGCVWRGGGGVRFYTKLHFWHQSEVCITGGSFSNWLKDTTAGFALTAD